LRALSLEFVYVINKASVPVEHWLYFVSFLAVVT
jgi:hypothetical protein